LPVFSRGTRASASLVVESMISSSNMLRVATGKLAISKPPRWNRTARLAAASVFGGTAAMAVSQAYDLRTAWKTKVAALSGGPCRGPTEGVEVAPPTLKHLDKFGPRKDVAVLFLGDSLVAGVGGQSDGKMRPAVLPRHLAASLAAKTGTSVRWASVGITGAGVEKLMQEGLPKLRAKLSSFGDNTTVVVVLVVGVNDLRQRNIVRYRFALRRLVNELRNLGDQVVDGVFLPSLQLMDAPLLQKFPLNLYLSPIAALWEREKRKAVGRFENAEVLSFPSIPDNTDPTHLFCADKMHPSASGYEFWAEGLAQQIDQRLKERRRIHGRSGHEQHIRSLSCAEVFMSHEVIW